MQPSSQGNRNCSLALSFGEAILIRCSALQVSPESPASAPGEVRNPKDPDPPRALHDSFRLRTVGLGFRV